MTPDDGDSADLSRKYALVVVLEAAVIAALWVFERVFS
jgi:hypothetical protein